MRTPPRPTAIVLAAGLSRRAAPHHKLLLPAPHAPALTVVRATTQALCAASAALAEIIVVTGHERTRVEAALTGLPVQFVFAPDFAAGMGHSLAAGVRHSRADTCGFLVTPGDLPGLTADVVRHVLDAAAAASHARHVVPTARGERGHPVFLAGSLRARLENLTGDVGARLLLATPEERSRIDLLELGDDAILRDVDR